jgi:hypothetical protein
MGKQLEYQKKSAKRDGQGRYATDAPSYQNGTSVTSDEKAYQRGTVYTRQTIAKQHGVGEQTVERNARFARNVDIIAAADVGELLRVCRLSCRVWSSIV